MDADRIKHLEFISATISRLNGNSFQAKSWCVAIVAAVFAVLDGNQPNRLGLIGLIATALFWAFDAYYLSLERQFRNMYAAVATSTATADFLMDPSPFKDNYASWASCLGSKSMGVYWSLMAVSGLVLVFANR